ncbi:hypothetical protein D9M68_674110 [compost metagenome]
MAVRSTLAYRRTARARCRRFRPWALQTITAAAPSLMGAHMGSVRGQETGRAASASSMVSGYWNCASGLSVECMWFLAATAASWRCVVPKVFMCRRARLA